MKRMGSWSTVVFTTLMLLAYTTGISWAATASGTISYSGAKAGRIYITAEYAGQPVGQPYPTPQYRGIGTSIANKAATFTLNGLQAGSYTLRAFMDVSDSGVQHANDPVTTSFPLLTIPDNSSSVSAGAITMADPTPVALTAPTDPMVFASQNNTGAIVTWKMPQDANQREIPTSYTVTWSSGASDATIVGSKTNIVANGSEMWIHNTATPYSYKVTAHLNGSSASTAWVSVTPPTSGLDPGSVSGTVTYSGVTPAGPLFIAAVPPNNGGPPLSISISSPALNSNGFTIPNLPDGSYNLYAFIDMNNSGSDDAGDYRLMDGNGVPVTVAGGNVTGVTVPLPISDVSFTLATQHMFFGEPGSTNSGENYSYEINISPQLKVPVKAQILNGTSISTPVDMGIGYEKGSMRLSIDNMVTGTPSYSFNIKVCYDDACTTNSATFPFSGTATFLQSPPLPTAPIGGVAYASASPLQWLAPPTLPAYYSLNVNSDNGFNFWTEGIAPSSVSYTDAGLTLPTNAANYYWTISAHDNASPSNSVGYQAQFSTAQSAPVISSISPASLYFGGTISIFGHNLGTTTGVSIGGKPAVSFIVINANQITAVVPQDPAGHIIVVTSPSGSGSSNILLGSGAPISLTGSVKDTAGTPISGATVQLVGNPVVSATSDGSGNFTISNLPNNFAFMLRIVKDGFTHTYTRPFNSSQNIITSTAYTLRSTAQFAGLGVPAGKGAIMARATDANGANLAGATFIYGSLKGLTYTVKYYDSVAKTFTGSATDSSGIVLIPDASHGDLITLTPAKAGWLFHSQQGRGALGSVTALGGISALQPDVTNVSTSSGTVGSPVTITGHNFTQDATVTFNGTLAVIAGNTGSVLTLSVPNGATTGPLVVSTSGIQLNSGSFTVLPTSYTLTKTIVGNGQINDGVLPCLSGSCVSTHDKDAPIALSAAESYGSIFSNWSGACTGTDKNVCGFSMTSNQSVTATFSKLDNAQVTMGLTSATSDTLTNAYATVAQNETIIKLLRSFVFTENFIVDKAFTVKLLGGFDSFTGTNKDNYSIIDLISQPFTISKGALTIENIILK